MFKLFIDLKYRIDEWILNAIAKGFDKVLYEPLKYALEGGKRLRGLLVVLTGLNFDCPIKKLVDYAVAIEIAHAASLVHDDIVDHSEYRRGKESLWKKFGIEVAVLLPHIMVSKAFSLISRAGKQVLDDFIEAWGKITYGQILDLEAMNNNLVIDYKELVKLKTGIGFEMSCYLGVVASGALEYLDVARKFGLNLGLAYQALDDLADIKKGAPTSGSSILLVKKWGGKAQRVVEDYAREYFLKALKYAEELDGKNIGYLKNFVSVSLKAIAREENLDIEFLSR